MDTCTARVLVVGLVVGCPYEANPADCALHEIRQRPLKERVEWTRQLTEEQIQNIIDIHKKCLARKEKSGD